jgi:hypothetical protein
MTPLLSKQTEVKDDQSLKESPGSFVVNNRGQKGWQKE